MQSQGRDCTGCLGRDTEHGGAYEETEVESVSAGTAAGAGDLKECQISKRDRGCLH